MEDAAPEEPAEPARGVDRGERRPPRTTPSRPPWPPLLIGVLTLLLGFAFTVQVRNSDDDQVLAGAREEDLVRILDELSAREDRLRDQIADQRSALRQLTSSDSETRLGAGGGAGPGRGALGILNGTVAAQGPGLA